MKAALILISLISLVSLFTLASLQTHKNLKSVEFDGETCLKTYIDFSTRDVIAMNTCDQRYQFKFTLTFPSQSLDFETECIFKGHNEIFSLEQLKFIANSQLTVTEQQEC
ncbi:hypothetical protein ABPG72_008248 [Tetrahymena utriculariae]